MSLHSDDRPAHTADLACLAFHHLPIFAKLYLTLLVRPAVKSPLTD